MALLVLQLVLLQLVAAALTEDTVQLSIDERQKSGTLVADLQKYVVASAMRFSFNLVNAPQYAFKYFAIENGSVLVTKSEIMKDVLIREQLCTADECRLALQVNATARSESHDVSDGMYQLINLEITVNHVIDQPCKFDKAVTTQDVNELSDDETAINLGNLNCPRLPASVSPRLTLIDSSRNTVNGRPSSFRLRLALIKVKPQSLFKVELVAPAGLDRELCEWHNFTVVATIGDREASARVFVHVDDADDNEPLFVRPSYSLPIRENAPPGEQIRLVAVDADSLPQNTEFEYAIISIKCRIVVGRPPNTREGDVDCPKGVFNLNPTTGALSILRPLNYEEVTQWTLLIGLRVYGSLVNSTATVTVEVENMNEAPVINGCGVNNVSRFSVPENLREPRTLCVLRARDEDGDLVKCDLSYDPYSTQKYDAKRFFHLEHLRRSDGVFEWNLTTAAFPLDYEDEREHRLMILCSDQPAENRPQLTVSSLIAVDVLNRNDPPKFTRPFYRHTLLEHDESSSLGTPHTAAPADRARKHNARLSLIVPNISVIIDSAFANISDVQLAILPSSADHAIDSAFHLRGNDLYVNDGFIFDRESRDWYNFSLLARLNSEPSLASTVPVAIEIADRNDNSPVFTTNDENMTIEVRIDTSPGRQVYCCLRAIDRDAGVNSRLQYTVIRAEAHAPLDSEIADRNTFPLNDYFLMDANTGELFLNKPLNASLVGSTVTLTVEARDQPSMGDSRIALTYLRLHFVRPLQLYVGASDRNAEFLFDFGNFNNVIVIVMIVGVTIVVSGLLIGLIVCIKSKNNSRRAVHQSAALPASVNGHPMVKAGRLKMKPQKNGGYSGFRRASPNHYYDVKTYEPNTITDIDYPEPNSNFAYSPNDGTCAAALHIHQGNAPLHFTGATLHANGMAMNLNVPVLQTQTTVESLNSSLTSSPKCTMVRPFTTETGQMIGVIGTLPPLSADVDLVATDIDSGQGSSTSTSKANDVPSMSIGHKHNGSTGTPVDSAEVLVPLPFASAFHSHDIYCTCSRKHGASTISRSTTPSPLPGQHAINLQPVIAQESCSPIIIKSILRGSHSNQQYKTMLPKHSRPAHEPASVSATTFVHVDDKKHTLMSSDV